MWYSSAWLRSVEQQIIGRVDQLDSVWRKRILEMLSDVLLQLTWCLCRGTKFTRMDVCVGLCIVTAEGSGLFFYTCV